ncbi:RBBP9/YdeN family alpha/beta hydrolase [Hydrocarboniphaga sp.]|uniref:RBBP9/YdeN family alpha/beta hydrolase n=1 Tax=Hydrocarboniphaga sp. TaxID=2033016 RepID=UPI003D13D53D
MKLPKPIALLLASLGLIASTTGLAAEAGSSLRGKQVTIVHGYMASPQDHWFPWLKAKLEAEGAEVDVLSLPDSAHARADAWLGYLQANIRQPDANHYFVAHSLGCISLLRYLGGLPTQTRIGGFVLVSGFADSLSLLPQLDEFTAQPLDYRKLISIAPRRVAIASRDDGIVPYRQTAALSRSLKAPLLSVAHGGHFLGSEGHTQLPVVYDQLLSMILH